MSLQDMTVAEIDQLKSDYEVYVEDCLVDGTTPMDFSEYMIFVEESE